MNILSLDNISKYYGDKILFSDISLHVNDYNKIGLIRVAGTGKTTLLRIIASVDRLDYGEYSNDRSRGELYMLICDEMKDITYEEVIFIIINTLIQVIQDTLSLTRIQLNRIFEIFIESLPSHIKNWLIS